MATIEVKNLSKTYESYQKAPGMKGSFKAFFRREKIFIKAVNNINFSINEGELIGFLGPNGAGKTTTLKMLSGILYPSSGQATVLGYIPWQRRSEYQKQFTLVMGQKNQLWWDLPVIESIVLNKEIYEVNDREYKKNLEELVELLEAKEILNVPTRKLSLGQRMKGELIAALIHQPKILFLDEPTIGLDVVAQKNIRDFIKKYNQEKKTTIVLTSHYMEDIKELCQRVVIIDRGSIIYDGDLPKLIQEYSPEKILNITFSEPIERSVMEKFGEIETFEPTIIKIKVERSRVKEMAAKILASKLPVDDILINEADISDVVRKIFLKNKIIDN
jgi:ABC-2 type transport system ATP-binding protein